MQTDEPNILLVVGVILAFALIFFGFLWLWDRLLEKLNRPGVYRRVDEIATFLKDWGFEEFVDPEPVPKEHAKVFEKMNDGRFKWLEFNRTESQFAGKISISCSVHGDASVKEVTIRFVTPSLYREEEGPSKGLIELKESRVNKRFSRKIVDEKTAEVVFNRLSEITEDLSSQGEKAESDQDVFHARIEAPLYRSLADELRQKKPPKRRGLPWALILPVVYFTAGFLSESTLAFFSITGVLSLVYLASAWYSVDNISNHWLKTFNIWFILFGLWVFIAVGALALAMEVFPYQGGKEGVFLIILAAFFGASVHLGLQNGLHSLIWRKWN